MYCIVSVSYSNPSPINENEKKGLVNGDTASIATYTAIVEVAVSPHVFLCGASILFL
jgi:hypothetical protein